MQVYKSQLINIRTEANEAVIDIDGVIGEDWFSEGNTTQTVKDDIEAVNNIKADTITVNINSLGGDYFHGIGIHNILANHSARVEINIQGWTASAGTIIAMAGDKISIAANAGFLIHNAWTMTVGNKVELQNLIEQLGIIDSNQARMYSKRTGKSEAEIQALMDENDGNGRWLTAEEAQEWGFVDEVYETVKVAACTKASAESQLMNLQTNKTNDMTMFEKILNKVDEVLKHVSPKAEAEEETPAVEPTEEVVEETTEPVEEVVTPEQLETISAKVNSLEQVVNDYKAKADEAQAKVSDLTTANEALQAKVDEYETKLANGLETEGAEGGNRHGDKNVEAANNFVQYLSKRK